MVVILHHVSEVLARDVFHHQELSVLFKEMITDARERGMLQAIQKTRFTLNRLAIIVVHEKGFFDRYPASETLVRGDIHRTHTALPDLFFDAVSLLKNFTRFDHFV